MNGRSTFGTRFLFEHIHVCEAGHTWPHTPGPLPRLFLCSASSHRASRKIEGVDYDKTFAPFAKLASLRAILAIAAERHLEMSLPRATATGQSSHWIFLPLSKLNSASMITCLWSVCYLGRYRTARMRKVERLACSFSLVTAVIGICWGLRGRQGGHGDDALC